jgi:hypothetical protein
LSTGTHKKNGSSAPKKETPPGSWRPLRIVAAAAVVVGIVIIALGAIFLGNRNAPSSTASDGSARDGDQAGKYAFEVGSPGPGEEAPPMKLRSTEGGTFNLASMRGQTVLLYFQEGLMCQPCWNQMKDIEARWGDFKALGIDKMVSITHEPLDASKQKVES